MSFKNFNVLGCEIAKEWGTEAEIKELSDERKTMCLMAAVLAELQGTRQDAREAHERILRRLALIFSQMRLDADAAEEKPIPWWVIAGRFEMAITPADLEKLGPRGRRAIRIGEFLDWPSVTEESLSVLPRCGPHTVKEVMRLRNVRVRGGAA